MSSVEVGTSRERFFIKPVEPTAGRIEAELVDEAGRAVMRYSAPAKEGGAEHAFRMLDSVRTNLVRAISDLEDALQAPTRPRSVPLGLRTEFGTALIFVVTSIALLIAVMGRDTGDGAFAAYLALILAGLLGLFPLRRRVFSLIHATVLRPVAHGIIQPGRERVTAVADQTTGKPCLAIEFCDAAGTAVLTASIPLSSSGRAPSWVIQAFAWEAGRIADAERQSLEAAQTAREESLRLGSLEAHQQQLLDETE